MEPRASVRLATHANWEDYSKERIEEDTVDTSLRIEISETSANIPDDNNMHQLMVALKHEMWTLMNQYGPAMEDEQEEAKRLECSAIALMEHYEQSGSTNILNEAIHLLRRMCVLFPVEHPNHSIVLNNLAVALWVGFQHNGNIGALAECIGLYRDALAMRPHGHPDRGSLVSNLAGALVADYKHSGNIKALSECVELYRNALALRPHGHPHYGDSLNDLASVLMRVYERGGHIEALVECISLNRAALELHPDGHPNRGVSLNSLAIALMTDYNHSGNMSVLMECIRLNCNGLALCPRDHPNRGNTLNSLATALLTQYKHSGLIIALSTCIDLFREALALHTHGHPNRGMLLSNLASALMTEYEHSGDLRMLGESIGLHYEALELLPPGHLHRGASLTNLCNAHFKAYETTGLDEALQHALQVAQESLDSYHPDSPQAQRALYMLAKFQLKESPRHNLREALDCLTRAVTGISAPPRRRLHYATDLIHPIEQACMRYSEESNPAQPVLDFYLLAIELLPLAANYSLKNESRLSELIRSEQLCRAATIQAILCGELLLAVQVYEEGKGVFWTQSLSSRSTAFDSLPLDDKNELISLFNRLEKDDGSSAIDINDRAKHEHWAEGRRQLNIQVEQLLVNIRQRPGFDRFLRTPLYDNLKYAASGGPVVILVSSQRGCFAIIVQSHSPPGAVALKSMNGGGLQKLQITVSASGMRNWENRQESIGWEDTPNSSESEGRPIKKTKKRNSTQESEALLEIWNGIVKPVVDHLKLQRSHGRDRPRIHWCVSGELASLPLHAAGIYNDEQDCRTRAAAYIVSSYTPTLSALIRARENFVAVPRHDLQAALYADSGGDEGYSHIPNVEEEVQRAACILTSGLATVHSHINEVFQVNTFSERTNKAHILHLACHGQQNEDPLKSCFALKPALTISALMTLDLKLAMLAYLSACETAKGDAMQPDQAVHLAASMLFCGFRSVVATMWTMSDIDGPNMAEWFYEELMKNEVISLDDIPYALDTSVERLRKSIGSARRWATYMHLGA